MTTLLRKYSGFIVFCFVFGLGLAISPTFRSPSNLFDILQMCAESGLIATGMTLVIISGGSGIDLSVGSNLALGCMIAALTQVNLNFPIWTSFLAVVVCCGLVGAANGFFITFGRLQPFVATLGTMIGARALALIVNGGMPVTSGLTQDYLNIARGKVGPIFYPAFIWLAVIAVFHFVLTYSRYGRDLMAAGGNEESSRYSGIKVDKVRFIAYTISGVLAGIAGAILTARLAIGEPRSGIGFELIAIAAVVIGGTSFEGGRGSIVGTMFGVLTLAMISNLLNVMNVNMHLQRVFQGLIVLAAVLMPFFTAQVGKMSARSQTKGTS